MSEKQNRGIGDMSKYDAMTTEELEEILRLDVQAPEEQESDTEKILYIMEVLAKRKRNNSHTGKTALEAYESFKQNYMPETDHVIPMKPARRMPRWARALTATAAVLVILFVGSITVEAMGFNIWKAVVQWTQETFHFGDWGGSDTDNKLQFDSLQDALAQGNVPVSLVPTWIPDGYELVDIVVEQTPKRKAYRAQYTDGEKDLKITVHDYLDESPVYVEQSEGLTEEYEVFGITYYLFSNLEHNRAVWLYESYECEVFGDVMIEELKLMIDSIQKG